MENNNNIDFYRHIARELDLPYHNHNLEKNPDIYKNSFNMDEDNMIYFYPLNDGMPTCNFYFYKNGKLVFGNYGEYSNITNLDDILLQMVRIYDKALDYDIVLNPYYFMLKLTDDIHSNYRGEAKLFITDKVVMNPTLNDNNKDEANRYFVNKFLDHFMGWNFGVSINRNELLKEELEKLNNKVINMGLREYAGTGLDVIGCEDIVVDGLQHYSLKTEKEITKNKVLK